MSNPVVIFKYGPSLEGKVVDDNDFVAINKGMAEDANDDAKKFGSIYKGDNILGTTEADKLRITEDITVTGVTVGELTNGTVIKAGEDIMSVLRKMLVKEIGVTATLPYVTLSGDQSGMYEKGTVFTDKTYTATLVDGVFTGKPGYVYTKNAGCKPVYVSWHGVTGETSEEHPYQIKANTFTLLEPTSITAKIIYDDSTVIPKTNLGNDDPCKISTGVAVPSSSILYTPQLKWWAGYSTELYEQTTWTSDMVRSLDLVPGKWITEKSPVFVEFPEGSKQWVIALPENVSFIAKDSLNMDLTERFMQNKQKVTVTCGGTHTEVYDVYVTPINFGATKSKVMIKLK